MCTQTAVLRSGRCSRHRLHSSQVLRRPQVTSRSSLACSFKSSFRATSFGEVLLAPHSKRSSASDLVCEANTKHNVWIRRCAAGSAPAVSPIVHVRSAQVEIGERESRWGWGQQLVVRGQLHSPMVKLLMRVAHVAPIRAPARSVGERVWLRPRRMCCTPTRRQHHSEADIHRQTGRL